MDESGHLGEDGLNDSKIANQNNNNNNYNGIVFIFKTTTFFLTKTTHLFKNFCEIFNLPVSLFFLFCSSSEHLGSRV